MSFIVSMMATTVSASTLPPMSTNDGAPGWGAREKVASNGATMSGTSGPVPEAARETGAVAAADPLRDGGAAGTAGGAAAGTAGGAADGAAGGAADGAAGATGSAGTGWDRTCVSWVQPP